MLPVGSLD